MEPNQNPYQPTNQIKQKTSVKDFFLNLGAIVALYTVIYNVINLLFTVINKAYPQITTGYYYYYGSASYSISFPVATLIIFFPIFILLMWLLEKGYISEPEKKHLNVRKWLTYITLFIAGLALAGDLVTVLYYFIDGQELTTAFLLKILVVLLLSGLVFYYYISDIREKLNSQSQKIWLGVSVAFIIFSIVWGFSVLGSPRTQQFIKYDEQKVTDLQSISSQVVAFYQLNGKLPETLVSLTDQISYYSIPKDQQTGNMYEYQNMGDKKYQVCAVFNKKSNPSGSSYPAVQAYPARADNISWEHPEGKFCYTLVVPMNIANPYEKSLPMY